MSKIEETSFLDELMLNHADECATVPVGTFYGTIYKSQYRLNGSIIPSDTSEQLMADRLN